MKRRMIIMTWVWLPNTPKALHTSLNGHTAVRTRVVSRPLELAAQAIPSPGMLHRGTRSVKRDYGPHFKKTLQ
eukprot:4004610-Amphidinium_carterae.1